MQELVTAQHHATVNVTKTVIAVAVATKKQKNATAKMANVSVMTIVHAKKKQNSVYSTKMNATETVIVILNAIVNNYPNTFEKGEQGGRGNERLQNETRTRAVVLCPHSALTNYDTRLNKNIVNFLSKGTPKECLLIYNRD